MLRKNKKDHLYLQVEELNRYKELDHLFSTRMGWNQEDLIGDLADVLDLEEESIYMASQVHGRDIGIIKDQDSKDIKKEKLDGLITNKPGIALVTYHADCVPLYFYDPEKKVIGLAHAGWKGSLNNIAGAMIDVFKEEYGSEAKDIVAVIGPSIGQAHYEIGPDVEGLFRSKHKDADDLILLKNKRTYLDLWKTNKSNLIQGGIREENIISTEFCTASNLDILYSYRLEKTSNRMLAAIILKN